MNPDMQKELIAHLDALAAKLGVTAQYLWTVLVHQGHIEGVQDGIVSILSFVSVVACIPLTRYLYRKCDNDGETSYCLVPLVVGIIAVFVCGTYGFAAFSELANPQFWALQKIMAGFK